MSTLQIVEDRTSSPNTLSIPRFVRERDLCDVDGFSDAFLLVNITAGLSDLNKCVNLLKPVAQGLDLQRYQRKVRDDLNRIDLMLAASAVHLAEYRDAPKVEAGEDVLNTPSLSGTEEDFLPDSIRGAKEPMSVLKLAAGMGTMVWQISAKLSSQSSRNVSARQVEETLAELAEARRSLAENLEVEAPLTVTFRKECAEFKNFISEREAEFRETPQKIIGEYFRELVRTFTRDKEWTAKRLTQLLYDHTTGVHRACAELGVPQHADELSKLRKENSTIPFGAFGIRIPTHHESDLHYLFLKAGELRQLSIEISVECERTLSIVSGSRAQPAEGEPRRVVDVLLFEFDSIAPELFAAMQKERALTLHGRSRLITTLELLGKACRHLGFEADTRLLHRMVPDERDLPIMNAWLDDRHPDGRTRIAVRNNFRQFLDGVRRDFYGEAGFDLQVEQRALQVLQGEVSEEPGYSLTGEILNAPQRHVDKFFQRAIADSSSPRPLFHAVNSFYDWALQEKLTTFICRTPEPPAFRGALAGVSRAVAWLTAPASPKALLQSKAKLEELNSLSHGGRRIDPSPLDRKLIAAFFDRFAARLTEEVAREAPPTLQSQIMGAAALLRVKCMNDERVIEAGIPVLKEIVSILKAAR